MREKERKINERKSIQDISNASEMVKREKNLVGFVCFVSTRRFICIRSLFCWMFFQLEELNRSFVMGDKRSGRGKFMGGRRFLETV
jgi:hypothetical protein